MPGALYCQLRAGRLAHSASGSTGHANSEMRRVSVQGPQLFAGWRARLRHRHTLQHQRLAPLAYNASGAAAWRTHTLHAHDTAVTSSSAPTYRGGRRDMHTACLALLHGACTSQACDNDCASCLASAHRSAPTTQTSACARARRSCCTHPALPTALHCTSATHNRCNSHPSIVAWIRHAQRAAVPAWHPPVR